MDTGHRYFLQEFTISFYGLEILIYICPIKQGDMKTKTKEAEMDLDSLIGKYVNRYLYTDINPVGLIVGVRGKSTLVIQRIECTPDDSVKMEFVPGGFSAICLNNHAQAWHFHLKDEFITLRVSKSLFRNHQIEETPVKFYDHNF